MKVRIEKGTARGVIAAPPSKSFAHRLLIGASLAGGGTVSGIADSEDILATLDCAAACFSLKYEKAGGAVKIISSDVRGESSGVLNCCESGSTLRFFIPLCLLKPTESVFSGSERLFSRPLDVYEELCRERGLGFSARDGGLAVRGPLEAGRFTVRGDVSSQFITGLLFALPQLSGDSELQITPPIESKPYIDITLESLRLFGIEARFVRENVIRIAGNQKYREADVIVEGDYSNAAFLSAFSLIGGDVEVTGLNENSVQGDRVYADYFEAIKRGGATLDVKECPDLAPILMAMAAVFGGATLVGTRRLKIKESDRGAAMAEELAKFGVGVDVYDDEIRVGGGLRAPSEPIASHNDHRIAMAAAVLLSITGGELLGAEAVRKSYPDFFSDIKKLGIEVYEIDA